MARIGCMMELFHLLFFAVIKNYTFSLGMLYRLMLIYGLLTHWVWQYFAVKLSSILEPANLGALGCVFCAGERYKNAQLASLLLPLPSGAK